MKYRFKLFVLLIASLFVLSCESDFFAEPESVKTLDATDVTEHSATLHAKLVKTQSVYGSYNFVYGTNKNEVAKGKGETSSSVNVENDRFAFTLHKLTSGTTYYFVAMRGGKVYDSPKAFTTKSYPDGNVGEIKVVPLSTSIDEFSFVMISNYQSNSYKIGWYMSEDGVPGPDNNIEQSSEVIISGDKHLERFFTYRIDCLDKTYKIRPFVYDNGQYRYGQILTIKTPAPTAGTAIDMGCKKKWARCNLGCNSPEQVELYAFGETKPKNEYTLENYLFNDGSLNKDITGSALDAATANLGSDWQMASESDYDELRENCRWKFSQYKDVEGYCFQAKNGNILFMPFYYCRYGTTVLFRTGNNSVVHITPTIYGYSPSDGYPVRPVKIR